MGVTGEKERTDRGGGKPGEEKEGGKILTKTNHHETNFGDALCQRDLLLTLRPCVNCKRRGRREMSCDLPPDTKGGGVQKAPGGVA